MAFYPGIQGNAPQQPEGLVGDGRTEFGGARPQNPLIHPDNTLLNMQHMMGTMAGGTGGPWRMPEQYGREFMNGPNMPYGGTADRFGPPQQSNPYLQAQQRYIQQQQQPQQQYGLGAMPDAFGGRMYGVSSGMPSYGQGLAYLPQYGKGEFHNPYFRQTT